MIVLKFKHIIMVFFLIFQDFIMQTKFWSKTSSEFLLDRNLVCIIKS